ncbi:transcription antitermination factor NusB [Basilea psittacipulmonis]|uniref:Transcription antitermination protein NusB n=1 Tax=Basilea psittacipulmonis DSM 24701 TaxID=1072685 RepID=A0A077DG87_9BURK|nr:transcription antitermination factor NusB [Basilea psittacipulmonis]AIL32487.1 antitermination protein NusB [Basilea psittacipulmonis DSM 24701]
MKPSRSPKRSARRVARILAIQAIYAYLVSDDDALSVEDLYDIVAQDSDENYEHADREFLQKLIYGVYQHAGELREKFAPYIERPVAELSPVEHAILLLASYEFVYNLETPYRVIINEAIELAKELGGTDGFKFINGVLDKLAADVRKVEIE